MLVVLFKYKDELDPNYWFQSVFLILPAILTAAAGYVVNDIFEKARERNNENLATSPINRDENDSFLNNFKELLFGGDDDVVTPSGGDKAIGGGVTSGTAYRVGEQGPETFLAGMDGAIIPNMKAMLIYKF